MNEKDLDRFIEVALEAARAAGEIIRAAFFSRQSSTIKGGNVELKGSFDLVTETDKACERTIFSILRSHFPDHVFIGEESVGIDEEPQLTNDPTWIVDPVDGTTNFVHGVPVVCVSIGLVINKKTQVGVVFNPITNELFQAAKGRGTLLNGKPIHVSSTTTLQHSLIATGFPYDRSDLRLDFVLGNLRSVLKQAREVRRLGSAAADLCSVALGVMDAYYEYTIFSWDIAAGVIIVEEAGGIVIDPRGRDLDLNSGMLLAANSKELAGKLAEILLPLPLNWRHPGIKTPNPPARITP